MTPKIVEELRRALATMGSDSMKYSGHSFISGAATTAGAQGVEDSQMKLLGWQKSVAYQCYIQPQGTQLLSVATCLSTPGRPSQPATNSPTQQGKARLPETYC